MEPYLPSEINLLVLRHLAREGCSETIRSYSSESPSIKEFLSSNAGIDNVEAVRQKLRGPSVNGGLVEVLSDYGRAKILVNDLVSNLFKWKVLSPYYLSSYDSLATQIAHISKLVESKFNSSQSVSEDKSIGTADFPEFTPPPLPSTSSTVENQKQSLNVSTNSTQTGETEENLSPGKLRRLATFMEEAPVLNKIVSIANKQLVQRGDTQQHGSGTVETVCNTETEIDKVLLDILYGISGETLPKTILDSNHSQNNMETTPNNTESNIMTLFQDAQSIIESTPIPGTSASIRPEDSVTKQAAGTSLMDFLETPNKFNFTSSIYTPPSKTLTVVNRKSDTSPDEISSGGQTATSQFQHSATEVNRASFSRVNSPKVLPKNYSIIPITPNPSETWKNTWKTRLHRREIKPKIVPPPPRVVELRNETPNKRKAKLQSPVKLTPEKASNTDLNFVCLPANRHMKESPFKKSRLSTVVIESYPSAALEEGELEEGECSNSIPLIDVESVSESSPLKNSLTTINYDDLHSAKKPSIPSEISTKTPPLSIIVTPSKPVNIEPSQPNNIQSQEQQKVNVTVQTDAATTTMVHTNPVSITPNLVSDENQTTPVTEGSNLKTSESLLSSSRITRQSSSSNLQKKSLSTPRKNRHIRNLMFKTPPGAKSERTENEHARRNALTEASSTKRKATDFLPDFKTRKRLKLSSTTEVTKPVDTPLEPITEVSTPSPIISISKKPDPTQSFRQLAADMMDEKNRRRDTGGGSQTTTTRHSEVKSSSTRSSEGKSTTGNSESKSDNARNSESRYDTRNSGNKSTSRSNESKSTSRNSENKSTPRSNEKKSTPRNSERKSTPRNNERKSIPRNNERKSSTNDRRKLTEETKDRQRRRDSGGSRTTSNSKSYSSKSKNDEPKESTEESSRRSRQPSRRCKASNSAKNDSNVSRHDKDDKVSKGEKESKSQKDTNNVPLPLDQSLKSSRGDKVILNVNIQSGPPKVASILPGVIPISNQNEKNIPQQLVQQTETTSLSSASASFHSNSMTGSIIEQLQSISSPAKIPRQSPRGKRSSNSSSKSPLRRILPKPVPADYPNTAFTPIMYDQPREYTLSILSNSPTSKTRAGKSFGSTPHKDSSSSSSKNSSWDLNTSIPPTPRFLISNLGGDSVTQFPTDQSRGEAPYHFLTSTPLKLGPPRTPGRDFSAVESSLNSNPAPIFNSPSLFATPLKPLENNKSVNNNSTLTTNNTSTPSLLVNTNTSVSSTVPNTSGKSKNVLSKLVEMAKKSSTLNSTTSPVVSNKIDEIRNKTDKSPPVPAQPGNSIVIPTTKKMANSSLTSSPSPVVSNKNEKIKKKTDDRRPLVTSPTKSVITSTTKKMNNSKSFSASPVVTNKNDKSKKKAGDSRALATPSAKSIITSPTHKMTSNDKIKNLSVKFAVSGRQKSLTVSEHESLIGLLQVGNSRSPS